MKKAALFASLVSLIFVSACGASAVDDASEYPKGDVDVIVPWPAGGVTDVTARMLIDAINGTDFGAKLRPENREGAAGVIGMEEMVRAKPDGYTIMITTGGVITQRPVIDEVSYEDKYRAIASFLDTPFALVVAGDSQWKSIDEFLDAARQNPGKISIAIGGTGTAADFMTQSLQTITGAKFKIVPMQGDAAGTIAVLGKNADAQLAAAGSLAPQVKSGDLRVLLSAHENNPAFPEAPTPSSIGADGDLFPVTFSVVLAPREMDDAAADKVLQAVREAVKTPKFVESADKLGMAINVTEGEALEKKIAEQRAATEEFLGSK